ncbi:TIP41-domain-containing protein [Fistulina hepatica ATCC 64428]|uniref:TIP41-domain-containing protein n=1 Tax=Fistulina hepatica ATCC 64428 TaxID=1128425 RepID=A0A0D7AL95_9AGAR|nr:TIP41-domain-containing protein [Fistulina hepatica ATCC 64428]
MDLPPHKLFETPNARSIQIGDWFITARTNPISNAPQCDAMQATLKFPLPEMTFGNNSLIIEHKPSGWTYAFATEDALRCVKEGELASEDGPVKVGYADAWLKNPFGSLPMPKTVPTKPYDWTYTTVYQGHTPSSVPESPYADEDDEETKPPSSPIRNFLWAPSDPDNPLHRINMEELMRPDPILFYAEIPLFEDELHDNGSSNLLIRIRVMPSCFFILSRFTLRVDGVLFRTYDTRIYHSFVQNDAPIVVRESNGLEAPYGRVKEVRQAGPCGPRRNFNNF